MVLRPKSIRRAFVAALGLGLALCLTNVVACGTSAVGVESCKKIEGARCENANSCNISLASPAHRGDTAVLDVVACKRFYDDACLHGLVVTVDPGVVAVDACVAAINNATDCAIVKNPEKAPACAFLVPPAAAPVVDAATE
jgi:hypothetical protein